MYFCRSHGALLSGVLPPPGHCCTYVGRGSRCGYSSWLAGARESGIGTTRSRCGRHDTSNTALNANKQHHRPREDCCFCLLTSDGTAQRRTICIHYTIYKYFCNAVEIMLMVHALTSRSPFQKHHVPRISPGAMSPVEVVQNRRLLLRLHECTRAD